MYSFDISYRPQTGLPIFACRPLYQLIRAVLNKVLVIVAKAQLGHNVDKETAKYKPLSKLLPTKVQVRKNNAKQTKSHHKIYIYISNV